MNRVDVWLDDAHLGGRALVGHLAKTPSRSGDTISFEYAEDWRSGRSPVSPFPPGPGAASLFDSASARPRSRRVEFAAHHSCGLPLRRPMRHCSLRAGSGTDGCLVRPDTHTTTS